MNATEWDLIRRCRQGVSGAFEPLVRRHEGPALGFAAALLGDEDEAADALQDAFVLAYRALPRLREGSAFGPWFRSIVRNVCLDRLRAPGVKRRRPFQTDEIDRTAWSEATAERAVQWAELGVELARAMATLPDEQRTVLLLREIEGLSYGEIATELAIPPGTVASRLNHARSALRAALLARGIGLEDLT